MRKGFCFLAVGTGLEPATPCVTGMYTNQLYYPTVSVEGGAKLQVFLTPQTDNSIF